MAQPESIEAAAEPFLVIARRSLIFCVSTASAFSRSACGQAWRDSASGAVSPSRVEVPSLENVLKLGDQNERVADEFISNRSFN